MCVVSKLLIVGIYSTVKFGTEEPKRRGKNFGQIIRNGERIIHRCEFLNKTREIDLSCARGIAVTVFFSKSNNTHQNISN